MFPVVRVWQSTLDLYPISCSGLDGQDRQISGLTGYMTMCPLLGKVQQKYSLC